jgi:hypothetical protein
VVAETGLLRMAWLYDLKAVEAECRVITKVSGDTSRLEMAD